MNQEPTRGHSVGLPELALRIAERCRQPTLAPIRIAATVLIVDLTLFALAFWFMRFALSQPAEFSPGLAALVATVSSAALCGLIVLMRGYKLSKLQKPFRRGLVVCSGFVALGLGAEQIAPSGAVLTGILGQAVVIAIVAILPSRLLIAKTVTWAVDSGLTRRRAVLAGGGEPAEQLVRALSAKPGNDIDVQAIFDDRDDTRSAAHILEVPKIGRFSDLVAFVRICRIDLVIITLPLDAENRIGEVLSDFRVIPMSIHFAEFSRDLSFEDRSRGKVLASLAHEASYRPERRLAKRSFDLLFGALAFLLLTPVMILCALAVKLDSPGPVLFRQMRHGFNDSEIEVLKFRTMYHHQSDPAALRVVTKGDGRVTRVGRFLRKASLDELPQLFNVLGGSLSLVGPRPHAVDAQSSTQERFQRLVDGYSARHRLPPGITGWAQINGFRGEIDCGEKLKSRVAHDLFYIENWSIWFDIKILLRTPVSLLDTRNAY